jgi:DNA-binding MarR family transcriptional regulator/uncharacterized glyoxalase superfamily protein PhnB
LPNLVREYTSAVLRHAAATAKRMSLEASELATLEHLQASGPMTQKHLGRRLSMSPGAVTAMIDRLESRGYVQRSPNPEDRRSALVGITKAGIEESLRHLWPYIEDMRALEEAFGFTTTVRWGAPDGTVQHAKATFGEGALMMGTAENQSAPLVGASVGQGVYLRLRRGHRRALRASSSCRSPGSVPAGGYRVGYAPLRALDLEGYEWSFGNYRPGMAGDP